MRNLPSSMAVVLYHVIPQLQRAHYRVLDSQLLCTARVLGNTCMLLRVREIGKGERERERESFASSFGLVVKQISTCKECLNVGAI